MRVDEILERLPKVLRQLRKEAGLPIEDVAGLADLSEVTVRTAESGERSPEFRTVVKLLGVYGLGLSDLQMLIFDIARVEQIEALVTRVRELEARSEGS
jgi:transcriptional regulator with XRE-family HTH domain